AASLHFTPRATVAIPVLTPRPQRTGARVCLFRGRAGAQISGKIIGARRSKTDRRQHCEIAGAIRTPSDVGCAIRRRIAANIAKPPELVQKASPCYRAAAR